MTTRGAMLEAESAQVWMLSLMALTREELDDLYKRFTDVADHRKKDLMDEEIASLIQPSQEEALKVAAD